jgi:ABC-type uncharacterized transport system auxiliary subunit
MTRRTHRRALLGKAVLALPFLAGCSVLPDRPFVATRRHSLAPVRPPGAAPAQPTGQVLLLRSLRAPPGMDTRGLRRVRPDQTLDIAFYEEWLAAPAELAEAALRQWLIAGRGFTGVASPGTRLGSALILEGELTALEAIPGQGIARASLAALLLREPQGLGEAQVVGQRTFTATAPLPPAEGEAAGLAQANAMEAALGLTFAALESWLVSSVLQMRRR